MSFCWFSGWRIISGGWIDWRWIKRRDDEWQRLPWSTPVPEAKACSPLLLHHSGLQQLCRNYSCRLDKGSCARHNYNEQLPLGYHQVCNLWEFLCGKFINNMVWSGMAWTLINYPMPIAADDVIMQAPGIWDFRVKNYNWSKSVASHITSVTSNFYLN